MLWFLVLLSVTTSLAFSPPNCGQPKVYSAYHYITGHEIYAPDLPWVVRVHSPTRGGLCTGSLVSDRHVLTAAHCLFHNISGIGCSSSLLNYVKDAEFCHGALPSHGNCEGPTYKGKTFYNINEFVKGGCQMNDYALVELDRPAPNATPICLPIPENGELLYTGSYPSDLHAIGYCPNSGKFSLRYTNIGKPFRCNLFDWICATANPYALVCSGDSGGPLMEVHNGRFVIVGVVSGLTSYNVNGNTYDHHVSVEVKRYHSSIQNYINGQGTIW